jgi:L-asparaginase
LLTLVHLRDVARLLNERLSGDIAGAIVVQGTDTIEETAFVLDCLVGGDKPVVVTGAMRGAEAPGADGPANLLASAIVASSPLARGLGALVVLNETIHAARFVQKSKHVSAIDVRVTLGRTARLYHRGRGSRRYARDTEFRYCRRRSRK